MVDVVKTTKRDIIQDEFDYVMALFRKIEKEVDLVRKKRVYWHAKESEDDDSVDLDSDENQDVTDDLDEDERDVDQESDEDDDEEIVRLDACDLGKSYEILLYQACSLPLSDVLESLLKRLDVVPLSNNHYNAIEEEYHSSLLYDCLVIALEKNHQNIIDIILKCVVQKHKNTTSQTTSRSPKIGFMTLHCAAAKGNVEIIEVLIKAGLDVNQKNWDGETALHVASDAATAEILLNNGADVNGLKRKKKTPLYNACVSYRLGVIRELMKKGAKSNTPSMELNKACESGVDTKIASALMQFSVDQYEMNQCGLNCVHQAINDIKKGKLKEIYHLCANSKRENRAMVDKIRESYFGSEVRRVHQIPQLHHEILFLKKEGNTGLVDLQPIKTILTKSDTIVNAVNKFGTTALYLAVERDLFDVATLLLDSGADPNATFVKHPLITACRFLSYDFVRLLLERGADPNIFDCYLNSPLFIAAESYDLTLVKMLVEHGADVNRKDKKGSTVLHSIVENSFLRFHYCSGVNCVITVKYLLDNGFNVNQTNAKGKTVIAFVIDKFTGIYLRERFSRISILYQLFEMLLERGADVNLANLKAKNAMATATKGKSVYALQELLRHGGDAKYVRPSGKSLVGISCTKSDPRSARLLLAAGADINTITFKWLYWATKTYSTELIDLLLDSRVIINTSNNDDNENMKIPTLGEFYTPFCRGTECIVRLFKAGSSLQVLADCCRYRRKGVDVSPAPFNCPLAGLLCMAIVLAGYNVRLQLENSLNGSDDKNLASWLEEESMTPPTLFRLCRTVIRRQLSAASGYRTIIPLIDILEIPRQMQMYLKFEGHLTEIDLTFFAEKSSCASCGCPMYIFFYGNRLLSHRSDSEDEDSDD